MDRFRPLFELGELGAGERVRGKVGYQVPEQALDSLTDGLNSYTGSFAKATVDYRTLVEQDRDEAFAPSQGLRRQIYVAIALTLTGAAPGDCTMSAHDCWKARSVTSMPPQLTIGRRIS